MFKEFSKRVFPTFILFIYQYILSKGRETYSNKLVLYRVVDRQNLILNILFSLFFNFRVTLYQYYYLLSKIQRYYFLDNYIAYTAYYCCLNISVKGWQGYRYKSQQQGFSAARRNTGGFKASTQQFKFQYSLRFLIILYHNYKYLLPLLFKILYRFSGRLLMPIYFSIQVRQFCFKCELLPGITSTIIRLGE